MTGVASYGSVLGGILLFAALFRLWICRKRVSVKGKVVLITGASSGLGEAIAHAFYGAGAKLILCARRESELQRVKRELMAIESKYKKYVPEVLCLDLSNLDAIPDIAEAAICLHGHVDILINNGGISYRGTIMDTTIGIHQQVMLVNYFGQVALTRAILPSMISSGYGHVVGVSSIQGKISIPFRSAYSASKHALLAFLDCLRAELDQNKVYVSVVCPGYISTNLSKNAVTGNGSTYGILDATTAAGMPPDVVAKSILRAVTHRHNELILAPVAHVTLASVRNLLPSLFFKIMSKRAAGKHAEKSA